MRNRHHRRRLRGVGQNGVTLANGAHTESNTVIWTARMRASLFTAQIPAEHNNLGRLRCRPRPAHTLIGERLCHR